MAASTTEKAINLIKSLPRVTLGNLRDMPSRKIKFVRNQEGNYRQRKRFLPLDVPEIPTKVRKQSKIPIPSTASKIKPASSKLPAPARSKVKSASASAKKSAKTSSKPASAKTSAKPTSTTSELTPESLLKVQDRRRRGFIAGRTHGRGHKGQGQRNTLPRLGFEGNNTPFYLIIPKEPYYQREANRRQYPPLSLLQLQRMIDLGRIDPSQPVDLSSVCNTKLYVSDPAKKHFGINLTEEGADLFAAKINIEVQWASELVIAAIERNGGVISTRYFDPHCLFALVNPKKFFMRGIPIPRCKLPPEDALEYYTDPKFRGYLADPDRVREARIELAQKYGYELPDLKSDPLYDMMSIRKDPRQIFYGLNPGWVVNLRERHILKPKDEEYKAFYES